MTGNEELRRRIKESEQKVYDIATHCGLSSQGLYNKLNGKNEWTASEILKLQGILHLSWADVRRIFFENGVGN